MSRIVRYDDCPVCIREGRLKGQRGKIARIESHLPKDYENCHLCGALLHVPGDLKKPISPVTVRVEKGPEEFIFRPAKPAALAS